MTNIHPTAEPPSDPWLRRVQALLAKAESTEFPAEAETLLAKAQELMTRHAIDETMLAAAGSRRRDDVVTELITVDLPYAGAKSALLSAVASANGCRVIIQGGGGRGARRCAVVGHRSDLAKVTTLFAALSLHAARTMLQAPVPPYDTARRFRHAFLLAFAARIGERLQEAARSAQVEVERESGRSVGLVLVDRSAAVDSAVDEQFPRLRAIRSQASSHAGYLSGRSAADTTALGQRPIAETVRGALQ